VRIGWCEDRGLLSNSESSCKPVLANGHFLYVQETLVEDERKVDGGRSVLDIDVVGWVQG
jgi:hypothetical protein